MMNPYEILGVPEGAGMEEIKRAYRRKAKEYHPDLHPDDPAANEKMQRVNQAYDMLCNPEKYRAQRQARPDPNPYAGSYARGDNAYRQGGWQYAYYSAAGNQGSRSAWQNPWQGDAERQQSAGIARPFRGIFRVIGCIMLFRFIITLLRFGWFGFFF